MGNIPLKNADEIAKLRTAGRIAGEVLTAVGKMIKAGMTTGEVNAAGEKLIREKGAIPVFIGYRGYRHACCVSVNEEVVHGIPKNRVLAEGDIVSLDVGVKIDGYCGDNAATYAVGKIDKKSEKLLRTGRSALKAAIRQARAGKHLGDIGFAIQRLAEKNGFSVVRDLYGHGIGRDLHEDPLVPNYGVPGEGPELKAGMVLAIEPMLNLGGWKIKTLPDGWTVVTEDGGLSCHFEQTVLITEGEPEVLTLLRSPSVNYGG